MLVVSLEVTYYSWQYCRHHSQEPQGLHFPWPALSQSGYFPYYYITVLICMHSAHVLYTQLMHSYIPTTCDTLCLSKVPNSPYVHTGCRSTGCVPPGIRGCSSQVDNPEARCTASEIKRLHTKQTYEIGHPFLCSIELCLPCLYTLARCQQAWRHDFENTDDKV